ncbi:MIZ zinc finger family protein [Trichomonas vaginalis G3]|uniref:MIZ zinc finger family protein n=1 Tax=Trichomonas vaginalis (strain ATCC PRA-98 / G3) TaxID=412133 RepID=A2FSF1_TRIV3|nr:zinc finger, RING/FYVE/PHD-type domain-containing protein [Trichomonas vaginalis G3]EAX92180.1 MIZ zinc finger family protein [Trichomonas vaginalis G3]KAI5547656.1 zinc finger, RING/FYVE/PHD-type domain-containing protein [Trichomonas vaginalis G3]|eukprot:XP_001305110.1 MIZ zinc finger family protein [Trichomonas vaginalis G3]
MYQNAQYGDGFDFQDYPEQQQPQNTEEEGSQQPPASGSVLSQEDFDSLIKTVQLLRISQLRYIVQKFAIPASGNKTKLLGLVIQIFHNLRYDPVLVQIYQEINNLLAQQDAPFSSPSLTSSSIELSQPNPEYIPSFNLCIIINFEASVFGPLLAKPGRSANKFRFTTPPAVRPTIVTFLFYNGNPQPFSIQFELNGIPFEISKDDSQPAPIDVTAVLSQPGIENVLDIKAVNCAVPIMIQLFQYEYVGLRACIHQICGNIDISKEQPMVKTNTCAHHNGFSLVQYLSSALSTGHWFCPVCGADASLQNLIVLQSVPVPNSPPQQQASQQLTPPQQQPVQQANQQQAPVQPQMQQVMMSPQPPAIPSESIFGIQTGDFFQASLIDQMDWDSF